ncbi:MAG: winged helix-turn-helix transcriptional regulator [Clostridiales bacterium]|nr:winged helix-turn-helix transcriptional regulator [Clostridiales bacterium]
MDEDLRNRFVQTMLRFKKMGIVFPPELDIRMGELMVMKAIEGAAPSEGNDVFVSDIHSYHFMTKPAISQILNGLEEKKYVRRKIDKADRRKIAVTLTPKGKDILAQTKEFADDMIGTVISRFGEDNTRQLIELFTQLTDVSEEVKQEFLNQDNKGGNALD